MLTCPISHNTTSACISQQEHACREYLQALVGYFESFYTRTQPLGSLSKIYAKLGDFEARFRAGQMPGWADGGIANGDAAANGLDMTAFATVEEVESLGEPLASHTLSASHCRRLES